MAKSYGPTLTEIAMISRKAIYAALIGFVILAFATYGMRQYQEWQRLHPPRIEEKQNYLFGKVPEIKFPKKELTDLNLHLELTTGVYPETPQLVKVYRLQTQKFSGFDPVQSGRDFAMKLDFTEGEKKVDDSVYEFTDKNNLSRKISINVINQSFKIESDLKNSNQLITTQSLPSPDESMNFARTFLSSIGLDTSHINLETPTIIYYRLEADGNLTKTILPFDANLIKVIFGRRAIDEKAVFFNDESRGVAVFSLAKSPENQIQVVEAAYNGNTIDEGVVGTYFAKPAATAWEELKSKKEYIIDRGELIEPIIRNMYLGFYDELDGAYLQPVWVFEGDKNFKAVVPAVLPK